MRFAPSRLRSGEWIVAISAVVLLVLMFVPAWYDPRVADVASLNGFHSLTGLRWLVLITLATAFALVFFQATRRAPAMPVSFSVFVTVLGALTSLWMIYRVLISSPVSGSLYKQTAADRPPRWDGLNGGRPAPAGAPRMGRDARPRAGPTRRPAGEARARRRGGRADGG
jgi:hypothetical protein